MGHPMIAAAIAGAMLATAAAQARAGGGPNGLWSMSNGKVSVKVSQCGAGLCGTIVGLKEPISKIDGKPKVDRENPDPALRQRALIGLSILIGMKPAGDAAWKGQIYNPDDGKTYSATVKLDGDVMKVRGCVLAVLCKTNDFTRIN